MAAEPKILELAPGPDAPTEVVQVFQQGGSDKLAVQAMFDGRAEHMAAAGLNPPHGGAAGLKVMIEPRYGSGYTPIGTVLAIFDSDRGADWFEDWSYFSWSHQWNSFPPVWPADWTVERDFHLTLYEETCKARWFRLFNEDRGNTVWI